MPWGWEDCIDTQVSQHVAPRSINVESELTSLLADCKACAAWKMHQAVAHGRWCQAILLADLLTDGGSNNARATKPVQHPVCAAWAKKASSLQTVDILTEGDARAQAAHNDTSPTVLKTPTAAGRPLFLVLVHAHVDQ
eukprot:CAMPEP_0119109336 /NCGR_PEP_ID=MMETSP1180-20130426/17852_1 /TAXON_ID=3052 ORGANISM="Chlamydomonas cf sp, Strain CCMP681" /NCGR_SAMPLE_ID=MMETSP1180 /ASSEMBLY_ACC=CAM_ASM_000741 /LENGTH=137 /DNA_ID=CAMNT_0007095079 /DNA_START=756 /DNA_END=1169 /DNA_ORIENTATION=+